MLFCILNTAKRFDMIIHLFNLMKNKDFIQKSNLV